MVCSGDFSFDRTRDTPPAVRYPYQWNYPRTIHPLVYAKLLSDEELRSYVGDLWQVPDDHRLSLTVSRNGLTEYFTQPKAEQQLQTCKRFLNSVSLLRIYDIDGYGQRRCYESISGYQGSPQQPLRISDTIWVTYHEHRHRHSLRRVYPRGSSPAPWRRIMYVGDECFRAWTELTYFL